jgi:pilus assembly protein Flp/PilA
MISAMSVGIWHGCCFTPNHETCGVARWKSHPVTGDRESQAIESRASFHFLTRRINMTQLLAASKSFVRDEEGASLVEYGLLLALIAVVCIAAVTTLGTSISTMLNSLAGKI